MQVSIADAKARLAEIVRLAENGEDVVLTRHGKPVVRLSPAGATAGGPLIGALAGKVRIADDFDDLPEDFLAHFSAGETPR